MAASDIVPLHVLGTDVDLHVGGHRRSHLAQVLRDRWHLCLRADGTPTSAEPPRVVGATLLEPDAAPGASATSDPAAAPGWARGDSVSDSDEPRLLQRLTQSVTYAAIGARSGELLMLHAAGLADPVTGATAAFVAPGNTGKTTLCRTLGPARSYVSDETVGVRRDGTVTPYPKPLSTRRPDWAGVKDEQAPGSLGLRPPEVTPWLAGVVLLRRVEGHRGAPEVEELDVLDAIMAITPESSAFMRTERPLHWLADVLDRTGGARRVTYGEVGELEPLVGEICGRRSPW